MNWKVSHNGEIWYSIIPANVWEPGVSGWRIVPAEGEVPMWVQPTGAHDAYKMGDIVFHNGKIWRSLHPANVWEPTPSNTTLWEEVIDEEEPPVEEPPIEEPPVEEPDPEPPIEIPEEYPAWRQPTGGHDAYGMGERVSHNGKNWESLHSANVWEPSESLPTLWKVIP